MKYFVNLNSIIDRICSAVGIKMYKNGLLTIIGLLLFAGIAGAQETADGRRLNDAWQPRNQHATIDNAPGFSGDWSVITEAQSGIIRQLCLCNMVVFVW
jgi:hypothetical protein